MTLRRRDYLAAVGSAATVGVAGCLDGGKSVQTSYECALNSADPDMTLPNPTLGPDYAPVTVEIFADFACPDCATFAVNGLQQLKAIYLPDNSVQFRHFDFVGPVSDTWSFPVANAARSVQAALDDAAFFEFSLEAYRNQDDYSWQRLGDIGESVGADPCRVLSAAANGAYDRLLMNNRSDGMRRGIDGTPAIYVNGTQLTVPDDVSYYERVNNAITANLPGDQNGE